MYAFAFGIVQAELKCGAGGCLCIAARHDVAAPRAALCELRILRDMKLHGPLGVVRGHARGFAVGCLLVIDQALQFAGLEQA